MAVAPQRRDNVGCLSQLASLAPPGPWCLEQYQTKGLAGVPFWNYIILKELYFRLAVTADSKAVSVRSWECAVRSSYALGKRGPFISLDYRIRNSKTVLHNFLSRGTSKLNASSMKRGVFRSFTSGLAKRGTE
jgi:hypothetical protein